MEKINDYMHMPFAKEFDEKWKRDVWNPILKQTKEAKQNCVFLIINTEAKGAFESFLNGLNTNYFYRGTCGEISQHFKAGLRIPVFGYVYEISV